MINTYRKNSVLLFTLLISTGHLLLHASDMTRIIDLQGPCRFEIGNLPEYADPLYDESHWETIEIPGNWENRGFPGYDGYAWYRMHFKVSANMAGVSFYLNLGQIDDVDRVYINGRFLNGSGAFPPKYHSAWDQKRVYTIPNDFINFDGDNCLAVQVYDDEAEGGIVSGAIGIYIKKQPFQLAFNLAGEWKFMPGDNMEWHDADYMDQHWSAISVPGKWEYNGFPDLDGFAWYRKAFVLPKFMSDERWILVLGRIDDVDEVYFNNVRIGQTGEFPDRTDLSLETGYGKLRLYSIPRSLIYANRKNVIAVRVFDKGGEGGIYEGPVGLINRKIYLKNKNSFH